ncbi:PREDICTED: transcriptional activator DEMETER-like isoform X2 [Nelumbo nucifera]|uniref:Transcriptional activator DEMETER-like isoform X2 n=2 Tax=Nelumbo nucifera TaxID=4432 RepID=A0A1U8BMH0_NELNU|nr:PREDICTED: transcriptional activator DEMETER-like isoform X2 [Nelumbo nucifera]DAD28710.1 TPA_asm: hypothetical protein HUJ06_030178 [Nelumbo nucifera]
MDFISGVSIPGGKEQQIQGSWIPVTPARPVPTRPQPVPVNREGSQLETQSDPPELLQGTPTSNEAVRFHDSVLLVDHSIALDNWEAALAGNNRGSINMAGTHTQAFTDASACWNSSLFGDLFASTTPSSAAVPQWGNNNVVDSFFFPTEYSNIGQGSSNSARLLLENQGFLQIPPHNGFPVSHRPTYDLNALPKSVTDNVMDGATSFQFVPITPEKGKRVENHQLSEIANISVEERSNEGKEKHELSKLNEGNYAELELAGEKLPEPMVDASFTSLAGENNHRTEENHNRVKGGDHVIVENQNPANGDDHHLDLNKTPQQKPKRKKIRPKVVVEGKPKRPRKSVTPKQTSAKENPSGKRKYVRKKGLRASDTPPAAVLEKTNDPSVERAVRSCKRALDFNLDDQTRVETPGTSFGHQEGLPHRRDNSAYMWDLNLNSESQEQDLCTGINSGSRTRSTVQLGQGIEVTVHNTAGGIAYDLNCSMNQLIKDYISLPEIPAPTTPVSQRKDLKRRNLKVLARNRNQIGTTIACQNNGENDHQHLMHQHAHVDRTGNLALNTGIASVNNEGAAPIILQSGPQLIPKSSSHPDSSVHVPVAETTQTRGSKRGHSHSVDGTHLCSMNLTGVQYNSFKAYQSIHQGNELQSKSSPCMYFPEIYKKKRTKKSRNAIFSTSASAASLEDSCNQAKQTYYGRLGTRLSGIDGTWRPKNGVNKSIQDVYVTSTSAQHHHPMQNVSKELLWHTDAPQGTAIDDLQTSQFMLTFGFIAKTKKKRSNRPYRVRDLASLAAIAQCTQLPQSHPRTPISGNRQRSDTFHAPQSCLEALASDNYPKIITKKRAKRSSHINLKLFSSTNAWQLQKQKGWPYMISIDELVYRLKHLTISTNRNAGKEQNALIPYIGDGRIVSFEGPRRKLRPKVDLDPETNRVWNLLMGKEGSEGIDEMDEDKKKWWDKERTIFHGRAASFIQRMHTLQGDRRFSQWKGSVVDSVIGVFLTQNVSDHLSSSAFMALAARFPLRATNNHEAYQEDGMDILIEEPDVCIPDLDDTIKWNEKMSNRPVCDQESMILHDAEHMEEREMANSNESFESNVLNSSPTDNSNSRLTVVQDSLLEMFHESPENRTDSITTRTEFQDFAEVEDRREKEDVVSSQNSVDSSIFQITERIKSFPESNSEEEDLATGHKSKSFNARTSFTELLQMSETTKFLEFYNYESDNILDSLEDSLESIFPSNYLDPHAQVPIIPSSKDNLHMIPELGVLEVDSLEVLGEEIRSSLPSTLSEISESKEDCMVKGPGPVPDTVSEMIIKQNETSSGETAQRADSSASSSNHTDTVNQLCSSPSEACSKKDPHSSRHQQEERIENSHPKGVPIAETKKLDVLTERQNSSGDALDVMESTCLIGKQKPIDMEVVKSNFLEQMPAGITKDTMKQKRGKVEAEKSNEFDWDNLRREAYAKSGKRERSSDMMDSLDWEAVRCADVKEIADTIKERGMNNRLAERIKDFLNRLVREHEGIDLEWLRDIPPDKAKEYLLSVRGLGLKSVECVRLLTLHHLAFPVDTNVGRIAVRLGWVPLQPLPDSLQLHLLELYPVLETIQKYLWPRLCKLDQRTLYELHYQMITFGKVFCTKSKPNCNACPMRTECKHFASAFASARLALPMPEEKGLVSSTAPIVADQTPHVRTHPVLLPPPVPSPVSGATSETHNCEPIIEVPATPERECKEITESDIEDAFSEDPDEIPVIKLNIEEFKLNLQKYIEENKMELQEGDMSKALVALTPEAASIPVTKLKNINRLRTEHQVYELPDSHQLLLGVDRREHDDPCPYLLAIWTPGETAESIEPPKDNCSSQGLGNFCNEKTCFRCNSKREENSQTVRGTLLIPCRTAMRGSFPLNGTYFQVNEVFADHDSSLNPIDVPRAWLWNLRRRIVYFGTSIPTIFRGLSQEEIQNCFWRGFVCVRGFDQRTRVPRPLQLRFHSPASKLPKTKAQTAGQEKTQPNER